MRPLIITPEVTAKLLELVAHAEANPITMDAMLDTKNKAVAPIGDNDAFVVVLPFDYRVVLSVEQQNNINVYHASFSIPAPKKLPSVPSVGMILKTMGLPETDWLDFAIEPITEDHSAVNIWCEKA